MGNGEWGIGNGKRETGNFQFDSNSFNRFLPPIPPFRQGQESVFLKFPNPPKVLNERKKQNKHKIKCLGLRTTWGRGIWASWGTD